MQPTMLCMLQMAIQRCSARRATADKGILVSLNMVMIGSVSRRRSGINDGQDMNEDNEDFVISSLKVPPSSDNCEISFIS